MLNSPNHAKATEQTTEPAEAEDSSAGVLSLIGNTPLLRTTQLDTGLCTLSLKLENQNPGGSIKDRVARGIIEAAERDGKLKPGGTILEATAGNTGIGLAMVGALKGYRVILIVPDKMAREKVQHLRALGAEIIVTRSDVASGHPEYYQDIAKRLVDEIPGAFWADQFSNPANPATHEATTAREILAQCREQSSGQLDAFIAGVGSGGTITGCARGFRAADAQVQIIVADPEGSVIAEAVKSGKFSYHGGSWLVEGIGEDFIPPNLDLSLIDEAITISDAEAFAAIRDLLRHEGILAGSSSGTLLAAALAWCRKQTEPKHVVTLICDTGNKYLTRAFDDGWLRDEGLMDRDKGGGNLADLLSRRADRGELVSVAPHDTLATAYRRMRMADVSQVPVLDNGALVGFLDEDDLVQKVLGDEATKEAGFNQQVQEAMVRELELLDANASIADLREVLQRDRVGIVMKDGVFLGLLTRTDLLAAYARKDMP